MNQALIKGNNERMRQKFIIIFKLLCSLMFMLWKVVRVQRKITHSLGKAIRSTIPIIHIFSGGFLLQAE
jgi:hypothetical protein